MNTWKLVPETPTEAMEDAHFDAHAKAKTVFADVPVLWTAMLAASPDPASDEALVERMARAIDPHVWEAQPDEVPYRIIEEAKKHSLRRALAAIRAMEEKP